MVETKGVHRWVSRHREESLERWLVGYRDIVRPSLLVGRYRTPHPTPQALETGLVEALGPHGDWRFGGSAAGNLLVPFYRGEVTVIHRQAEIERSIMKRLKAIPDHRGNLIVIRSPGPIGLEGRTLETAHPLLVYSEMMVSEERAREAAHGFYEQVVEPR